MAEEKKVTIEVIADFKYAHRGCAVVEYKAGEVVETSEDCAELAIAEKWAKSGKALKAAPENKDAADQVQHGIVARTVQKAKDKLNIK